ncbi:MAG: AlpA family transcriptional regulator [Rickettsiales bacterium]|nr:AlpA family transcriptional regulator [Rickettsiales bacterium]
MTKRIIRLSEVKSKTGLSRSSIYDGIKMNTFPAPIKITSHAVGWIESEVNDWIESRISNSRPIKASVPQQ